VLKDVLEDDESIDFTNYFDMMKPIVSKSNRIGIIGKGGQGDRIYTTNKKSVTLMAVSGGNGANTGLYLTNEETVRKLMPTECERLQNLPDDYTKGVSNSQRYKMIGNGWTVDVIAHILRGI
jgi:DNA (cytosine-5)-methyltransferase 3A